MPQVLFVDGGATGSTETGSIAQPFLTIQAAIDAVPEPHDIATSCEDWTILIAPGDYDEPLEISGPVRLALIGLGAFRLGRYTVQSATQANIVAVGGSARDLRWTYDLPQVISGGAAPQLVIGTIAGTDVIRHGKPIANRISGSIIVTGSAVSNAAGGTAFLAIQDTQVDAGLSASNTRWAPEEGGPNGEALDPRDLPAIDATGFAGILVDRHFHSRFRGPILGRPVPSAYVLATSFMTQYEQRVEVSQYASVDQAAFADGLTVVEPPGLGTLFSVVPPGIVNSTFKGEFRGPAGSLLLDSATNTWFIRNGSSLDSEASKLFLGGASATRRITDGVLLRDADCGLTILADPSGGAFNIRLPNAAGKNDLTFTLKNVGSAHTVTVLAAPGQPIDGAGSVVLMPSASVGSAITVVARDDAWWIIGRV